MPHAVLQDYRRRLGELGQLFPLFYLPTIPVHKIRAKVFEPKFLWFYAASLRDFLIKFDRNRLNALKVKGRLLKLLRNKNSE